MENLVLLDTHNLNSLDLNMCPLPIIIDVSSVRDLHVNDFIYGGDDSDDDNNTMIKMFLGKFKDVEVFRLSDQASGNRWKYVVLELNWLSNNYLLGIYQLMRSLKHLEELRIYAKYWHCGASTALLPVDFSFPCVMPKLKSVTLHGYAKPWNHWLQLVQFVLRSATCLDELVIVPKKKYIRLTAADELEFVKRVSSFHRSSPNASVLFAEEG
ncbi:hypothetical protein KSS87_005672 [Heliosperma pusillum]|nr:hypothetical protein KSS87_005672 [Heliosperma pusillum]